MREPGLWGAELRPFSRHGNPHQIVRWISHNRRAPLRMWQRRHCDLWYAAVKLCSHPFVKRVFPTIIVRESPGMVSVTGSSAAWEIRVPRVLAPATAIYFLQAKNYITMLRTNTIHVLPGYHSLHLGTLFRRVAAPVRRVSHSAEACAATSTLGRMALAMPELEQQLRSARDLRGHGARPQGRRGHEDRATLLHGARPRALAPAF